MSMNKEYRAELRDLNEQKRAIQRALKKMERDLTKALRELSRNVKRENLIATKQLNRIAKRRAILLGRLS